MILTTHALTGAIIGKNVNNPWIVIALSIIIHYLMDGIRHAEYFDDRIAKIKDTWWKVSLDLLIGGLIIYSTIFITQPPEEIIKNMILGAFFSVLPDSLTLIYWFSGKKLLTGIKAFHSLAHRYDKNPKYSPERQWNLKNARNDIIISVIAIIFLLI